MPALVDQEFGVSRVFNTKRNQVVLRNAGFHEIGVLCVDNVELENIFIEFLFGVNFINILRTTFSLVDPESVRTQSSCQYLLTLLGSTSVKAVHGTLMKLTPGVNFINVFTWAFFVQKCFCAFAKAKM